MNSKAKKVAVIGMLSAISYVVLVLVKFPIMTVSPTFSLSYEGKDIVITLGGLIFGPMTALITSIIVSFIEMITISTTGFIGFFMNVISSCAFACTAAIICRKMRSVVGDFIGLAAGVLLSTGCMILWNYVVTPIYMGIPRDAVASMLLPIFLPFNLIKNGINAILLFIMYSPISLALRKTRLLETK